MALETNKRIANSKGALLVPLMELNPSIVNKSILIATHHHSVFTVASITLLEPILIVRILLRLHRDPASRIKWIVIVAALPLAGMPTYLLLG